MPYSVPQGYFEGLVENRTRPAAKIVSITHRNWFKYAAAAVVTGLIVLSGLIYLTRKTVDPMEQPYALGQKEY
jgi:hypothetical protein